MEEAVEEVAEADICEDSRHHSRDHGQVLTPGVTIYQPVRDPQGLKTPKAHYRKDTGGPAIFQREIGSQSYYHCAQCARGL